MKTGDRNAKNKNVGDRNTNASATEANNGSRAEMYGMRGRRALPGASGRSITWWTGAVRRAVG